MSDEAAPRNVLVMPAWLYAEVKSLEAEVCCPDDTCYLIDSNGRVRALHILGPAGVASDEG